jgi:hypothetical protein
MSNINYKNIEIFLSCLYATDSPQKFDKIHDWWAYYARTIFEAHAYHDQCQTLRFLKQDLGIINAV